VDNSASLFDDIPPENEPAGKRKTEDTERADAKRSKLSTVQCEG